MEEWEALNALILKDILKLFKLQEEMDIIESRLLASEAELERMKEEL